MNLEELDYVLESLLFVSGDGLNSADICNALELQKSELTASVNRLKKKYSGKCGIRLLVFNGKLQFASNPDYKEAVSSVLNPVKERALSSAVLETVAIIAYRQPVTRLEVENIRGSSCDYTIQVLLNNDLIEVVGRKDSIGKPLLFGTTDEFLKRFHIESIDELPDYDELLSTIRMIETKPEATEEDSSSDLYNRDNPDFLDGEKVKYVESDPPADNADKESSKASDVDNTEITPEEETTATNRKD